MIDPRMIDPRLKLMPCPLCGSSASINNEEEPFVQCTDYENCNLCGPWNDQAGEKWNELAYLVFDGRKLRHAVERKWP